MVSPKARAALHTIFIAAVLLNGVIGALDIILGTLFILSPNLLIVIEPYRTLPIGTIIYTILSFIDTHARSMGAFYFFSHGAIKLFLVWGLYTARIWVYPIAIAFLAGFSLYQGYALSIEYSFFVAFLLACNVVVIGLIAHEYTIIKKTILADKKGLL